METDRKAGGGGGGDAGPAEADHFSWKKATTQVNGLIVGPLSITHYGEMRIVNHRTGDAALLFFSKQGFWDKGSDPREVTGQLLSKEGEVQYVLDGSWDLVEGWLSARRVVAAAAVVNGLSTGAWPYNRPCAHQYVCKSQSCMV